MCDRFPLRRITNFQFSPVVVVPFYSSSLVLLSTRQSCDRDFFRICDVAIGVALAQYDSSLNKRYSPPRKSIYILFFKEPNSSFRPVSIEKLTSLFILFLIFLHSIPRSRANWNSNDTPLFLFRHLKTVIKTICEKIIATIIWSFHSQVSLDRNINLETENFIRKIFRMNENWIANLQRRSERLENKEESGCMQCCRKNMNIGGKFSMLDTLGGGNRDLSSFHCHFSRMLDKTMPFVSRFCPESRPRSRALEF